MISRRLLLSGFATLALTSQSHAGFFGFKTKAERDAEAAADAADLKALKKSLRLARRSVLRWQAMRRSKKTPSKYSAFQDRSSRGSEPRTTLRR
jgi:hypothetical protein